MEPVLPVAEMMPVATARAVDKNRVGEEQAPGQLRVLIVEDNRDMARTMRTLLSRSGHEVQLAHSGPSGVEAARQWKPDVVLCDLSLPEMDGFEVARTLRQDPSLAATRLIAVSGHGRDEDRRGSHDAGFNLHLTKPVDPFELERILSRGERSTGERPCWSEPSELS